jgi:hypothetical protein
MDAALVKENKLRSVHDRLIGFPRFTPRFHVRPLWFGGVQRFF